MIVHAPTQPLSGTMDVDEFMAFLHTRPDGERWDLIEGVAVMMASPSYAHQQIVVNLLNLLNAVFAEQGLDLSAYPGGAVRAPGVKNFQPVPDVVVKPGIGDDDLYTERFRLVAEVLSPSNTRAEIDLKLRRYRAATENLYVIIINPREFRVEIHAKRNNWQAIKLTAAEDTIEMPEFGLRCNVVDLYRLTPLNPHRR